MGTGAANYTPPEWITAEFLQDVLKEYFKDDTLEVHEIIVKIVTVGAERGSGFASEMHRATFNLKRNDVTGKFSVIIKVNYILIYDYIMHIHTYISGTFCEINQ